MVDMNELDFEPEINEVDDFLPEFEELEVDEDFSDIMHIELAEKGFYD